MNDRAVGYGFDKATLVRFIEVSGDSPPCIAAGAGRDDDYKAVYDGLEEEFRLGRALIGARTAAGLSLVSQTFVSWNRIAIWLRRLEALRQELSADAILSRYPQS
jgi:hypothetical protein